MTRRGGGTIVRLAERRAQRAAARDALGRGALVELEDVGVTYDGRPAVTGVTLTIDRGEWLGMVGANGAGKTTLLRAIAGLVAHEGSVRIGGAPLAVMGRRQRARSVAYVPQSPELPPDMAVADYVLLGRTPHIGYLAVESSNDVEHCRALQQRLGLEPLADRLLSTLSGGERQRAVLARALAQEAPVLLMDEPTSALDVSHRVEALETVDSLRREWGLTVVSVLHDLTLAGQFADRLLLLAGRTVAAVGKPEEVLDEAVLAAAFGGAVRVLRTDDGELVIAPTRRGGTTRGARARQDAECRERSKEAR